jgi:hypothetical protein
MTGLMFYVHHTLTTTADMLECSRESRKESDRERKPYKISGNSHKGGEGRQQPHQIIN